MDEMQLELPFAEVLRSDDMSDAAGKLHDVTTTTAAPLTFGEVFTRRWVVKSILDLVDYTPDRPLYKQRLVEPSVGSGAFLVPAVERLLASARAAGVDFDDLADAIRGYDIQRVHVERCRELVAELLEREGCGDPWPIAERWVRCGDFLLGAKRAAADYVVGNPPYIRSEDLDDDVEAVYRQNWPTMRGRADIYVGFYERGLSLLKPGGRLGFICADRWMRNQYGARLRQFVASGFAVEHVWNMHDVDAFESDVSAYPAITVLARERQGAAVVADTDADFGPVVAADLVSWSRRSESNVFEARGVAAHRLPEWFPGGEYWPTGGPARLQLVDYLVKNFRPLADAATGTRVSIGVASGADGVFITQGLITVEPDRLLPLSMVSDLGSGSFCWGGRYLVNPWGSDGQLVSLADYPQLAAYLTQHPVVRRRYVAQKNPSAWYRTIDRVDPSLAERPKLLLQDMRATIHPVLERGGHYPHHNLYYVVSDQWDLEVLGGLLLSRIAQAFIEAFSVRMRGGTLRFQAQYLRRLPVPDPRSIDPEVRQLLRDAFRCRDIGAATRAAAEAYGLGPGTGFARDLGERA